MKSVAVFDFDGTLIHGDSLMPFLLRVAGPLTVYGALAEGLALYAYGKFKGSQEMRLRTHLKNVLLTRSLKGRSRDSLRATAKRLQLWCKWQAPILEALREHHTKGTTIIIASGSLDVYLPELLEGIPYDALICTDVGEENGIMTGAMVNGNCVRLRKEQRVAKWLKENGPFEESFGYGNLPHDLPMMYLVKHRIIVS